VLLRRWLGRIARVSRQSLGDSVSGPVNHKKLFKGRELLVLWIQSESTTIMPPGRLKVSRHLVETMGEIINSQAMYSDSITGIKLRDIASILIFK
jgi:hypothetical protein